jgi:raffinose/stachyose/melibiose transport system substrate-binding protein
MADKNEEHAGSSKFQKLGLILALAFYLVSIIMVVRIQKGGDILDKNVKTITFAHWQLEDGFRQGFDEAIKLFEEYKAKQGQQVKVIQTTVPIQGYGQWFMTQLVGGAPADVIELLGTSDIRNQYFTPLSQYIGGPNPFNQGTPLEGVPWKDTFEDDMRAGLDWNYAEYYGVGVCIHTFRMYVNMDLLQKATGSRKLPKTLTEWLNICEKMREYGKKVGKPIIPIGVRGFDRGTLSQLLGYYQSQINADLNDTLPEFCTDATATDILKALQEGKISKERQLAAINIVAEIGKYFCDGFPSTDLEQTKFLFFAGNVGFFPEGTWNAFSMINNSPFEVEIIDVPVIGPDHKYSKYFVGRPSEQGVGVGGLFGIPKAAKHFDLAFEFLQFITSWKINQMTMVEHSKWLAAVKKVKYSGIMEKMQPLPGSRRSNIGFYFGFGTKSWKEIYETLETLIINKVADPQEYFWKDFISRIPDMHDEMIEMIENEKRNMINIETIRSASALGLKQRELSPADASRLQISSQMNFENLISRYKSTRNIILTDQLLGNMKTGVK